MVTNMEKLYPMMAVSVSIVLWFAIIILLTIGYLLIHFNYIKPYLNKRKQNKDVKKNEPNTINNDIHNSNNSTSVPIQMDVPKNVPKRTKTNKKRG